MSSASLETVVVDGLALAKEIRQDLAKLVARHQEAGRRPPCLAVVLVGNDPASASYIKGKQRACGRVGMDSVEQLLPASASEQEVLAVVERLNRDEGVSEVDGELVGDVDTEGVLGIARIVTPHRRGVGPMTITMLLHNTLKAYEARLGA